MNKYIIIIIIILFFIFGCSTPDQRLEMASNIGTVVFRTTPEKPNINEIFIVLTDQNKLRIIDITRHAQICKIINIGYQCKKE